MDDSSKKKTDLLKPSSLYQLSFKSSLVEDVGWFIRLRWVAAIGVLFFALFLRAVVGTHGFFIPFIIVAGAIGVFNTGHLIVYRKLMQVEHRNLNHYEVFSNIQVGIDWLLLTVLVYYSGGIVSPFVFFYIFHIVISAILLPKIECYVQTMFAGLLVGVVVLLQTSSIIPYQPFFYSAHSEIMSYPVHILSLYGFFFAMLVISSFFATKLSGQLRSQNDELLRLRRELETAMKELQAADEALVNMTYKTAHEMRSPLTAVHSLLNVVLQGYSGALPVDIEKMIRRAVSRTSSLIEMTSNLLSLAAKSTAVEEEMKEISLNKAIEQAFTFFAPRAQSKELQYKLILPDENLRIYAKENDIQLLCSNLIDNAIKYTPKGKKVRVELSRNRNRAKIIIADSGIGIPHESLSRIFDKFYRAQNARSVEEMGTGLGLSLVKQIVDSYGGTIICASEPNIGTTFAVNLPLKKSSGRE